ncbi:MAG: VPLPA-CTERM sorting domain-containing protein [Pseudomonadota bacterium]
MKRISTALLALIGSLFISQAQAATILVNIEFGGANTGLTATGQFDYDPMTDTFSNIDITSQTGSLPGATYIAEPPTNVFGTTVAFISSTASDLTGARLITFNLSGSLTDLVAGTVASLGIVGPTGDIVCADAACSSFSELRGLVGGGAALTLAPEVPLPAALPLFVAGLGGLGLVQRRRRQTKA